ncbi:MAG TPA: universal stress protein [Cobetia sp.]|nr:universal stress protein [Cobetia sp.]
MLPKDIVVFLEEARPYDRRLAIAADIAACWDACLIAVFVATPLRAMPHAYAVAGPAMRALLEQHRVRVRDAETQVRERFEAMARARGISAEWRLSESEVAEELMLHARYAGLALVPPFESSPEPSMTVRMAEHVIFGSGRPTILIPDEWPAGRIGRRIVVGWNASREATRAVGDALPFLAQAEAVKVVCVCDEPDGELECREDFGADLCRHLARYGVQVTLEQVDGGKVGPVLLEQARAFHADMLVMGAYGHSRIRQLLVGSTTTEMIRNATVPLLILR